MKCLAKKELGEVARLFKILAGKNRLAILCWLKNGEKCVCEIFEHLKLRQNLVSHHLRVLREAGLIDYRVDGVKKIYRIDKKRFDLLKKKVNYFMEIKNEKN